ncbi:hypothetical protein [Streptomyces misionensis]|uniref:hypothetical protein n=1 Tax=Streptomyces misionensis TaxID=67331 RepID=UPI0033C1DB9B
MAIVTETFRLLGHEQPLRTIRRDEELLLTEPAPGPMKLWTDQPPLETVHFPQRYASQPFAPPRGLYESAQLRVEWQIMDNRQPFYHRNCDVDEISYQIAGERTLMTELGTVELQPGDFSRIPRGVAHDNYGRKESHLLFYTPAPVTEEHTAHHVSRPLFPPFDGWKAGTVTEVTTQCLGTPGHDVAAHCSDERLLLEQAHDEAGRLTLLRPDPAPATTAWLYRADGFRLGIARLSGTPGRRAYTRTLDADEIQYQISGRRVLLTQRGALELAPGDLVRVPLGVAHTSITDEPARHLTLLSHRPAPRVAPAARTAEPLTSRLVRELIAH